MSSDSSYADESADEGSPPLAKHILSSPPVPDNAGPSSPRQPSALTDQDARGHGALDGKVNPFAQGDDAATYFTRPNRFFGAPSTWRSWTAEERNVARGLDRVRSQDLALHLLSAFYLKRRARQALQAPASTGPRPEQGSHKGKERALSADSTRALVPTDENENSDDESVHRDWTRALRMWTAWPMPPGQVPQVELLPLLGAHDDYRAPRESRPSADLEAWLVATALNMSRQRWEQRQWEDADDAEDPPTQPVDQGQPAFDTDVHDPLRELGADSELESDDVDAHGPVFSSHDYDLPRARDEGAPVNVRTRDDSDQEQEAPGHRPVPMADDETARQYFLPSARHILTQLDRLLGGLHTARLSYAEKRRRRHVPSVDRGDLTDVEPPLPSQPKSRQGNRSSTRPESRKRKRSSSADTDISTRSTASTSSGPRSRSAQGRRLRDWSDVVGMAALTGWDTAVVERASLRCAQLFSENMLFRTFHEAKGGDGEHTAPAVTPHLALESDYSYSSAVEDEDEDQDDGDDSENEDNAAAELSHAPCEACLASTSTCEPVDPQQRDLQPCVNCRVAGLQCSGIHIDRHLPAPAYCCPHEWCPRHLIPFHRQRRLQQHLDDTHAGHTEPHSVRRSRAPSSTSVSNTDLDSDFYSTVESFREAGILCPVRGCRRGSLPFRSGRRLYDHVRRMHPGVEVAEVKKYEVLRRGERRGRWTNEKRKRMQSSSRSRGDDGARRSSPTGSV